MKLIADSAAPAACLERAFAVTSLAALTLLPGRPRDQQALLHIPCYHMQMQEQLAVLTCLIAIDSWNPGAGPGLAACISRVAVTCSHSLEGASHRFTASQLLQVSTDLVLP